MNMIVYFLIKLHTCGICKATEEAPDTGTAAKKQRQVIHQAKGSEHGKKVEDMKISIWVVCLCHFEDGY